MEEDSIYKKIQEAIESLPENFSILEEQIDVDLQMEYFNYPRKFKKDISIEDISDAQNELLNGEVPLTKKKDILVLLASLEKVEAFRAIEKYAQNPAPELKAWSILALQESRMVIQSSLMDEQQVYISTGLGGKGQNLRYFVVFIGNDDGLDFTLVQRKLIHDELEYSLNHHNGTLEEITFEQNLALILLLLPVKVELQNVFSSVINECNQYGNFIRQDIIITNVKRMNTDEIREFIHKGRSLDEESN